MKKLLSILSILFYLTANATNYYIDSSGSDAANGFTTATAWKTIAKFNSSFSSLSPGDSILFKRGQSFYGTPTISRSGSSGSPIIIGAYGTGSNPVITCLTTISSWTNLGSNIWGSTNPISTLATLNMVVINGVVTGMGRYPNTGYLHYQSHAANTSITSSNLTGTPNWTGAEVVIRKYRWILDRQGVTSQSGGTLNYSATSPYGNNNLYSPVDGNGFFLQNDSLTLDLQNEWYYSPSKKLKIYSTSSPTGVQVSTIDNTLMVDSHNYIDFVNLNFEGANLNGAYLSGANHINITNCSFISQGGNGIYGAASSYINITGGNITNALNNGIFFEYSMDNVTIDGLYVENTANIAGAMRSGDAAGEGIGVTGNGTIIRNSRVVNTGYHAIAFDGNNALIEKNYIDTYCTVKDDGGGIYTYISDRGIIRNNTVLNAIGAQAGTEAYYWEPFGKAAGIYLDAGIANHHAQVSGNNVAHGQWGGILINENGGNTITDNTVYDFAFSLYFDEVVAATIRTLYITRNKFIARTNTQATLYSQLYINESPGLFGTIDSNYYARPVDDNLSIQSTITGSSPTTRTLAGWQTYSGQDAHSHKSSKTITNTTDIRFEYNATSSNKTISLDANYIDVTGATYNGGITLAPYSSAVLIKTCFLSVPSTTIHTYYFSTLCGDDSRTSTQAKSNQTPWKSISKLNSFFSSLLAGDSVVFDRGETFYGTIVVNKSGSLGLPITIGAYGTGTNPIITGFTTVSSWQNSTTGNANIWESTSAVSTLNDMNMVVINGVNTAMGRFPNTGYLTYQSHTRAAYPSNAGSITSSSLNSAVTNWTGADAVIKTWNFQVVRCPVVSQSGGTLNYLAISRDQGQNGFGFFIENDVRTLDAQNEWYYNPSTKKIRIFSTSSPTNVQVSTLDTLVYAPGQSNLTFDGIDFTGSNRRAFFLCSSSNITIQNCNLNYHGLYAVWGGTNCGSASSNLNFNHNTVNHINSQAIVMQSEFVNPNISYNSFKNCGVLPGMFKPAKTNADVDQIFWDGAYGVTYSNHVNGLVMEYNTMDSVGFTAVYHEGSNERINNNEISHFGLNLMDCGGIYTYVGNNTQYTFGKIYSNIIHDAVGDITGVIDTTYKLTIGVYLDDHTGNTEVYNNSCFNLGFSGIQSGTNTNCNFHNNTSYNNGYAQGSFLSQGSFGGDVAVNDTSKDNIFVAKTASQRAAYFTSAVNDISSWFNNIDSNYYARPIDDNLTIQTAINTSTSGIFTDRSLAQWKTFMPAYDIHSKKSPVTITNVNQLDFRYNATTSPVVDTLSPGIWKDVRNASYSGTTTLQPYTSIVLMNTGATNVAPTANAGIDQTIQLPTSSIALSGSASDADGTVSSTLWTLVSGSGTITSPTSLTTTVTGLTGGISQFKLTATDNLGAQGSDIMQVTVNPANVSPTANAGTDQAIQLPTSTTTLTGSGNDPDGSITGYLWTKLSGPAGGTITSSTSSTTGITALGAGTYVFNLRVTDNQGATGNDQMSVVVSALANVAPTANAGIDQTIQLPTSSVNLVGSGNDPDGSIVGYSWAQISGPAATITNPSTASTSVTGMNTANTYQFKLTVTDNGGLTGSDNMIVTVTPANVPPLANAGSDQSITLPASTVTLSGSATDPDGSISSHTWTKILGTGGTITNPNSYTSTITGLSQGTYVFRLTATDNNGATGFDDMTVLVNPAININPTANAGVDQSVTWPTNSITLSGSGSDPDGTIVAYTWSKVSGPASNGITNAGSPTANVTGLTIGVYQFQLQVTDNSGGTGTDLMQTTVNKGSGSLSYIVTSKPFNFNPQQPDILTSPAGLATATTYNGLGQMPTNTGSYATVSNITDLAHWNSSPISGTFTITPLAGTFTASNQTFQYDSTLHTITVSTSNPAITYTLSNTPKRYKGVYSFTIHNTNTNFNVPDLTITMTITAGIAPPLSWFPVSPVTYNAAIGASQNNAGDINAGVYAYNPINGFIPTPPSQVLSVNFTPSDTNLAPIIGTTRTITVNQGSATISVIDTIQSFDASPKFVTASTSPSNINTLTVIYDDAHTSVGAHTGHVSLSSPLYTAPLVNFTLHITANIGNVFITNFSNRVYTGSQIIPTVTTSPAGLPYTITYNGGSTPPTGVSSTTVIATLNSPNVGADTVVMTIIPFIPIGSWGVISPVNYIYTVQSGILNATTATAGTWTYNVNVGDTLLPGTYNLIATFHPTDNVDFNSIVLTNSITVNKGSATINISNTSKQYNTQVQFATVTTNPANLDSLVVTYTGGHQNTGSYPISASLFSNLYTASTVTGTLTISQGSYTLSWAIPIAIQQNTALNYTLPTSSIAGSFTFNYPIGYVAQSNLTLTATFHPSDAVNYPTQVISVFQSVYGSPFGLPYFIHGNTIYLNLPQ